MGEIADDILDGLMCETCGSFFDDVMNGAQPPGFPRRCELCKKTEEKMTKPRRGGHLTALGILLLAALSPLPGWAKHSPSRYQQVGIASWYGPGFYGRRMANGKRFTGREFSAAHSSLPLGSHVTVTDLRTHRRVHVIISDRGGFGRKYHRIIDLSKRAAMSLHMRGTDPVKVVATSIPHQAKRRHNRRVARRWRHALTSIVRSDT